MTLLLLFLPGVFGIDVQTPSFHASVYHFAHRKYTRLLLSEVVIRRLENGPEENLTVPLMLNAGEQSEDFNMFPVEEYNEY